MIPCCILPQTTSVTRDCISSFNSMNMFEIISLPACVSSVRITGHLYKGKHLLSFVDNHDVTRVASILIKRKSSAFDLRSLPLACRVFHASIMAVNGVQKQTKVMVIRRCVPASKNRNGMISQLLFPDWQRQKKHSDALNYGDFRSVLLTNRQCIFERKTDSERVLVAINADDRAFYGTF